MLTSFCHQEVAGQALGLLKPAAPAHGESLLYLKCLAGVVVHQQSQLSVPDSMHVCNASCIPSKLHLVQHLPAGAGDDRQPPLPVQDDSPGGHRLPGTGRAP